jgi:CRISPR-associated endonuclease/helicase Cas3
VRFEEFFSRATGKTPFPYQVRLAAENQFPSLLQAPTGSGKTAAVVLAWLWRRRFAGEQVRDVTPRRLVYCLPMRVLVEQTRDNVVTWLERLGLAAAGDSLGPQESPVTVAVLMGGEEATEWDLHPERDAIIIGTQDMLLSRALNRGYGMSRYRWPLHFGLLGNDCVWAYDEVQLMGPGLATSAQLAAFHASLGSFGPEHELWMSATIKREWLETYDFAPTVSRLTECELDAADRSSPILAARLSARKMVIPLDADLGRDVARLAEMVLAEHRPGTLTLAMTNTVARAAKLYEAIERHLAPSRHKRRRSDDADQQVAAEPEPELLLIHSRFRPHERQKLVSKLNSETAPQGRIVVSTQVVEAGVDISAARLFTELAPWPSLVQRFGRCNRYGECDEGRVFWIDLVTGGRKGQSQAPPYADADLDRAREALAGLEDAGLLSLERHLGEIGTVGKDLYRYETDHLLRRRDFLELFDTTPDLAGNDMDISRFIRDGTETDAQVFWRDVPQGQVPDPEAVEGVAPSRGELCQVSVRELREFLKLGRQAFSWDFLGGRWRRITQSDVAPGRMFLIPCSDGGYLPERGWSLTSRTPVRSLAGDGVARRGAPEANDDEVASTEQQTLREHTEEVAAELDGLLGQVDELDNSWLAPALRSAARWHDRGKAHPVCQAALHGRGSDVAGRSLVDSFVPTGEILAKSGRAGLLRYERKGFRHELAGALAALQAGLPDLTCYLVAAHHGKVRLSIRSLPQETKPSDPTQRFARGIWDGDDLPKADLGEGQIAPRVTLSLQPAELGLSPTGEPSWAERTLRLRDEQTLGPYRLAYLESILRVADMRASARAVRDGADAPFERQRGASCETQEGSLNA